jgi:hypothetical protein
MTSALNRIPFAASGDATYRAKKIKLVRSVCVTSAS